MTTKLDVKKDRLVTLAVRMADMTGRVLEESRPKKGSRISTGTATSSRSWRPRSTDASPAKAS